MYKQSGNSHYQIHSLNLKESVIMQQNEIDDSEGHWNVERAITENEVVLAEKNGALKTVRVEKFGNSHRIFVQFTWRHEELFLSTTRTSKKPREFKDFSRLVQHIEKTYPSVNNFIVDLK